MKENKLTNHIIKQWIAVFLFFFLSLSLMACGSNEDAENTPASTQAADKTESKAETEDTADEEDTKAAAEDVDSENTDTENTDTEKISTGIPVTSSDVTVVLGEQGYNEVPIILEKGWFEDVFGEHNIHIEIATFNNGPEMIEAFTAGQLDFGPMGMQPGISGAANGAGATIIASFCDSPEGIVIASLKESGITTVADLKGKTVGTTIGSSAYSLLLKALDEEGLSIDTDVNFVNIDFASAPTALETGELDVSIGYASKFDEITKTDGDLFYYIKDASGYGISENILVGRDEFTQKYPDITENILALYQKANEFINSNPEEAIAINARYYGLDEDVIQTTVDRYVYDWIEEDVLKKDVDEYIQFMYDNDLLTERLDVDDAVDFTYFNEAFGK